MFDDDDGSVSRGFSDYIDEEVLKNEIKLMSSYNNKCPIFNYYEENSIPFTLETCIVSVFLKNKSKRDLLVKACKEKNMITGKN